MHRFGLFTSIASVSALLALSTVPAAADPGKADRARSAIAEARGKIEAGDKVGASAQAPELQARARASLASAEALLSRGKKDEAIADARHAGEFADMAIVTADRHKAADARDAEASAADAHRSAADANGRADSAEQAAAAANARANSAQQAAALAAAQTEALRNAPTTTTVATEKVVVATPPATRTVTVRQKAPVRKHRVVSKPARAVVEKTTTTVTTGQN